MAKIDHGSTYLYFVYPCNPLGYGELSDGFADFSPHISHPSLQSWVRLGLVSHKLPQHFKILVDLRISVRACLCSRLLLRNRERCSGVGGDASYL